ncbi:MAG: ester cyclase [candidate division Zixibacteria bacterium]|nr:ester cyclase [candidate division Zixibacteria bacterium]
MKYVTVFIVLAAILMLSALSGCSQNSAAREMEERNKALMKRIHREVSNGNLEIFDEVLAPDYVRHCQAMPPGLQEIHGTETFKAFVADFVNAVSNCKDEIDFIIADSNMVAYVTTTTGVQTGSMGDLPPSNKEFMLKNIVIQRIENGKVAETWISWDNVAMLTQLGFFPPVESEEP